MSFTTEITDDWQTLVCPHGRISFALPCGCDDGYIERCLIKIRKGDKPLFDMHHGIVTPRITGYAIIPVEDLEPLDKLWRIVNLAPKYPTLANALGNAEMVLRMCESEERA